MKKFLEMCLNNDEMETIEVETQINNETCFISFFKETDFITIAFWNHHFGDEQKFIETYSFDSFIEYVEKNDLLMRIDKSWDYSNESINESYSDQDFDEWIYEDEAKDALIEFVDFQLTIYGTKYVKRNIFERISRWFQEKMYNLKNQE